MYGWHLVKDVINKGNKLILLNLQQIFKNYIKPDKLPPRIIKYKDYKNFESNASDKSQKLSYE